MGRRRASALRRARAVAGASVVLALVTGGVRAATSAPSRVPSPNPAVAPADDAESSDATPAATGVVKIPDSAYEYPSDAIFVAPNGNDSGAGTIADPFDTVAHAITVASAGAT